MKITFTLTAVCIAALSFAQVVISNSTSTADPSEILKIESTNQGVLFPNVELVALNQPAPVSNPAENLIVFNLNPALGEGFYMWQTNKWKPLIDSRNIYAYAGIVKTTTVKSTASYLDSDLTEAVSYSIDEAPGTRWKEIPGVGAFIEIFSPQNNVSVNVSGIVQGIGATGNDQLYSYAIGIFVDDQLKVVRNFLLKGNGTCLYSDFNVFGTLDNLPVGVHEVKVYETFRAKIGDNSIANLNFGGSNSNCTNLNDDMSRTLMNIQVSEKPNN